MNAALMEPAGTVTWLGAVRLGLLLDTVTLVPPLGADVLRVTVHVTVPPPVKVAGLQASADTLAGVTGPAFRLSEKVWDVAFPVAVNSA